MIHSYFTAVLLIGVLFFLAPTAHAQVKNRRMLYTQKANAEILVNALGQNVVRISNLTNASLNCTLQVCIGTYSVGLPNHCSGQVYTGRGIIVPPRGGLTGFTERVLTSVSRGSSVIFRSADDLHCDPITNTPRLPRGFESSTHPAENHDSAR